MPPFSMPSSFSFAQAPPGLHKRMPGGRTLAAARRRVQTRADRELVDADQGLVDADQGLAPKEPNDVMERIDLCS